ALTPELVVARIAPAEFGTKIIAVGSAIHGTVVASSGTARSVRSLVSSSGRAQRVLSAGAEWPQQSGAVPTRGGRSVIARQEATCSTTCALLCTGGWCALRSSRS